MFLADFGKRQVMRVRAARAGGTFRVVSKEDLFVEPPEDFRPVGIALSVDGASLYICDWNHRDVKANVSVGRLWKLRYRHASHAAEKPSWFVQAASGRRFEAATEHLIAALSHSAKSVRLAAQRELARRKASSPLISLLQDSNASPQARWHALWALDAIDGQKAANGAVRRVASDSDPSVRRQAIRQLGTRRIQFATTPLADSLKDPDRSVRFHAATALGRIGDLNAIKPLIHALDEQDLFARYATFTALNRIGRARPEVWTEIANGLESELAIIRENTEIALRQTYDLNLVKGLRHPNAPVRLAAKNAVRAIRKPALPRIQSQLGRLPSETAAALKELYADDDRAREIFGSITRAASPDDYLAYVLKHPGDASVGRSLFNDADRLACLQCHMTGSQGRRIGPDLTSAGAQFSRRELAESILFPNRAVREGYQSVSLELRDGENVTGLLSSESAVDVTLLDATGIVRRIPKQNIAKRQTGTLSLMPEGLAQGLTFEQFAGLIAFLESLRPAP